MSMFRRQHRPSTPPSISSRRRRKAATRREARPPASWRCSTGTSSCCIPRERSPTACHTRPLCACPVPGDTEPRCPSPANPGARSSFGRRRSPLSSIRRCSPAPTFAPSSWAPIAARRTTCISPATATAPSRSAPIWRTSTRTWSPKPARCSLPATTGLITSSSPSATTWRTSAWSTTNPATTAWASAPWSTPARECSPAPCCRTSSCTPGTASTAGPSDSPRAAPMAATIRP